jgi:hypothetical protein
MATEIELFESTNSKALWIVIKKEKLFTVNFIFILIECLNKEFVTRKWQICYS